MQESYLVEFQTVIHCDQINVHTLLVILTSLNVDFLYQTLRDI